MNINSPVFIPLQLTTQQQQQSTVALTTTNEKSPLMGSSTAIAKTPNFAPWQQQQQQQQLLLQSNISNYNYYQQQRQQQFFYHQQQQRHFYNPNLQYGQWSNMTQQQQKKILQQQQQQQQQQKTSNNKKLQQQHHHHQQQQRNKIVKPSKMLTSSTTATKLKVLVTLPPAELKLEAVAAAASTTTTTETEKTIATMKDDTMQRNGSKASQHSTKSHHQHHHHQQHSPSKHDSSDSGLSSHGVAVSAQNNSNKSRKSARSSSKRIDCNRSKIAGTSSTRAATAVEEETTTFSVNAWLGRDMVYCYERRFIASCAEDNMIPRHNTTHRNSTSSDMAASDELNSSSSNEDLSTAYLVNAKSNKKTKSRQKRQQKRSKQQSNQTHTHDVITTTIPMDIDEELKENRRPPNNQQHTGQATKHNAATAANLRKQCTKAAALKLVAGVTNKANVSATMKTGGNALATSTSGSSVCSSLSASSSATSIPSSVSSSAASTPNHSPTASPTISKRNAGNFKKIARALAPPLRQHTKLQLTEQQLVSQLRRYIIDPNLLRVYGFPVESAIHEGCVEIYKCLPKPFTTHHHHHPNAGGTLSGSSAQNRQSVQHATSNVINTNDGLYVPHFNNDAQQLSSADSGQGSGVSSPPSVDSDSSEVGEDEPATTTAFYTPDGSYQIFSQYDQSLEKQCVRCNGTFHVTETGEYLTQEECRFHWGKLNHMYTSSKGFAYQYSCCEGDQSEVGCSSNRLHVWTGAVVGINGPYTDFVHTKRRLGGGGVSHYHYERGTTTRSTKVYALDCEMSFTGLGLEVTKITVVGHDGQMVYEHFVRPEAEIVDYNTRFSGITANDLCASSTNSVKTLSQVQRDLLQLFDADTILIGHGLDNDLRVLRIVHKTIIDTSIAFPHASGFPYRRALKHLTKVCLNRDIQCSEAGHSSFEDSRACLELMLWKVRKEMRHDDWVAATAMAGQ